MTAFNSKAGGFQLTTVGRVQTPTLAILVEREEKIRAFVPRDYWEVHGTFRAAGRRVRGPLVRREVQEGRRRSRRARRAPVGRGKRAQAIAAKCVGKPGDRHRGVEAVDAEPAAALRPDEPAARGQRPLRLLGAHDAVARAGAVREAQGADLPAHRLARAARGLHRHRQGDAGGARRDATRTARFAREVLKEKWVRPNKRIFDNTQDLRSLRDHPDARRAEAPERGRAEALRPRRARFLAVFYPAGRVPRHHAHHARRGRAVQDRRQGAGRAGLARRLRQGSAGRGRRDARAGRSRTRRSRTEKVDVDAARRRAAAALQRRRRCSRRWKARAS